MLKAFKGTLRLTFAPCLTKKYGATKHFELAKKSAPGERAVSRGDVMML